jgi:hypothetical protein
MQVVYELAHDGASNALSIEDVQQGLSARLEVCLLLLKLASVAKQVDFFAAVAHDSQCVAALAQWAAEASDVAAGTGTGTTTASSSSRSAAGAVPAATGCSSTSNPKEAATCGTSSSSSSPSRFPTRQWTFSDAELQQLRRQALSQEVEQVVQAVASTSTLEDGGMQPPCPQLLAALVLAKCLETSGSIEGSHAGALMQLYMRCLAAGAQRLVHSLTRLLLKAGDGAGQADGTHQQPLLLSHQEALSGLLHLALQPAHPDYGVGVPTWAQQALVEVVAVLQLQGPVPPLWTQLLQLVQGGTPAALAVARALLAHPQLCDKLVAGPLLPAVMEGAGAALVAGGLPELMWAGYVLLRLVNGCRPHVSTGANAAAQCEALLGQVLQLLMRQHSSHHEVWSFVSHVIRERACVLTAVPGVAGVIAAGLQQGLGAEVEGGDLGSALMGVCLSLHVDGACWDLVMTDEACLSAVAAAVCAGRGMCPEAMSLLQELCVHPKGLLAVASTSEALVAFVEEDPPDSAAHLWDRIRHTDACVSAFLRAVAGGGFGHWRLLADAWGDGQMQGPALSTADVVTALVQGWPVVEEVKAACRLLPHLLQQEAFQDALRRDVNLQVAVASAISRAGRRAETEVVEVLQGPYKQLLIANPAALPHVVKACFTYHCYSKPSCEAVSWVAELDQTQQLLLGDKELISTCLQALYTHYVAEGGELPEECGVLQLLGPLPASQLAPLLMQHLASSSASVVQGALHALYWLNGVNGEHREVVTQNLQRMAQRLAHLEEVQHLTLGLQQAAVELAQQQAGRR